MARHLPLICLALTHTLVDTCAVMVGPLWKRLSDKFEFGIESLLIVFIVQSLPQSFSQPVFGYLRDRFRMGWLIWIAPIVAAVCLSLIGVASSVTVLCVLFVVGGIGIGAFHPEAAATVRQLHPQQRTRSLSLFMFGGAIGLSLGPLVGGALYQFFGFRGLLLLGPPVVLAVIVLDILRRRGGKPSETPCPASTQRIGLQEMLEGKWWLALLLLSVCSVRLVPNMGMDKVLAFTFDQGEKSLFQVGLVQTWFLLSASVGMLMMACWFRTGWERKFLIICPILGIPLMLLMGSPDCSRSTLQLLLIPTGLILWGTTPAMVSYAQQQFPRGAGLASAITMGAAWGFGGLIQAGITSWHIGRGEPRSAFYSFIPCLALAAIGAWFLPRSSTERASHSTAGTIEVV